MPSIEFPQQDYQFRLMGFNNSQFVDSALDTTKSYFKKYQSQQRLSSNGKYVAITITTNVDSKSQLEQYYTAIKKLPGFKLAL